MFYVLICVLAIFGAVNSYPVENQPDKQEVIFVPYDIKYIPIEISSHATKLQLEQKLKNVPFPSLEDVEIQNEDNPEKYEEEASNNVKQSQSQSLAALERIYDINKSKPSDDYVLVPISLLKTLGDKDKEDFSSEAHVISKRQAPGDDFLVYRPIIQLRRVSRNRRRVYRPPPLVGYLNDYDQFPTIA